jgi:non-ribosomal peptide synthetase component F
VEATSTILDRTYHPVYQASIAATHEFGSQLLDLELVPTHSELGLRYRSDLFAERAARRFLVQTKSYVDAMLVEGNALAVDHLVIEDDDYLSTVVTPNETRQPWPEAACIHELMFKAAEAHPSSMCLQGAQEYTYDQFGKAVRAVADALGPVYPDDRVALLLERDASMVAAIYGVLSAGGCYVPLEPDYPLERLKTVVEDAACKACVTQAYLRAGVLATFFSDLERPTILTHIVELGPRQGELDPFNPTERVISPYEPGPSKPQNLAYVFYTSGTTGKPKGVMVEHRGFQAHRLVPAALPPYG